MSRRLCAILGCWEKALVVWNQEGIKKASRRCFVEANNQWELPCVEGSHDHEPGQMHGKIRRSLRRANHKQGASLPWFELNFKLSPCRLKQEEAVCSIRLFNTSRGRRVHPGVQKLSAAVSHHPMSPLKKEDPRKQRQWSGLATLSNKASSGFLLFKVQEEVSQEESLLLVLVWRVQHGERWELRHGGSKGKVHGRWRRWSAH
ncbi:hypothetical protein YC2023_122031 [Brassica napus]